MSNSKLTFEQKQELREFKQENKDIEFFSFPEYGVTVGISVTSERMAEFAVSIASPTEVKFRRKVGEYHVAMRFENGQTLPLTLGAWPIEGSAESIMMAVR